MLTWLLDQKRAGEARAAIDAAEIVVTSSLTLADSERALVRAETEGILRAADGQRLRGLLQRALAAWMRMTVSEEILSRAARPFPVEPVRTLDAIHLATALIFSRALPDLQVLTYDDRVRRNAVAMGLG